MCPDRAVADKENVRYLRASEKSVDLRRHNLIGAGVTAPETDLYDAQVSIDGTP